MPRLPPKPDIEWRDGALISRAHDDVYFSREGGLDETAAVFHAGCDLPARWAQVRGAFTIVELGFGTGLNAIATWDLWARTRPPSGVLHVVSIESHLLDRADAARALAAFPQVADRARRLLAAWPVRAAAPQRLWFAEDAFALTVLIGDAAAMLAGLHARADAWFLDGFAPARNTAMWEQGVFDRMATLSAPDARVATYSVSGQVRRGLAAAGFAVEKRQGFAAKRERLEARLVTPPARTYTILPYADDPKPTHVAVVGGGIAGAAVAHAFGRRDVAVTLIEAGDCLGAGASGNPAGLIMPRLDRGDTPLARVFRAAHLAAIAAYRDIPDALLAMDVIERADARQDWAALADLATDPPFPPDLLVRDADDALRHRGGGLVRPARAIAAWTKDADVRCNAQVLGLAREGAGWRLDTHAGAIDADCVVLANGASLAALAPLPLQLRAGQIEWGGRDIPWQPARADGAYAASFEGGLLFGATFDATQSPIAVAHLEARARNLAQLAKLAPDWAAQIDHADLQSRAAVRAATPDRAPMAGLLPDWDAWRAHYAPIAHGRPPDVTAPAPRQRGLYVLGGLGARGLSLAPLLAERIAAEACGEPQALDQAALDAIHPGRFALRALRRNRR